MYILDEIHHVQYLKPWRLAASSILVLILVFTEFTLSDEPKTMAFSWSMWINEEFEICLKVLPQSVVKSPFTCLLGKLRTECFFNGIMAKFSIPWAIDTILFACCMIIWTKLLARWPTSHPLDSHFLGENKQIKAHLVDSHSVVSNDWWTAMYQFLAKSLIWASLDELE